MCASYDGNVMTLRRIQNSNGVAHNICQWCISVDACHTQKVQARVSSRQEQRERVIDARINVHDHRNAGVHDRSLGPDNVAAWPS